MAKYMLAVLSQPVKGQEDEYNKWYTDRHLSDILSVPGFTAAQRFRIKGSPLAGDPIWPYMAIYELEGDDPKATLDEMMRRAETGNMPISNALDKAAYCVLYEPITRRLTNADL